MDRDPDIILGKTRAAATSAQLADTENYSTNVSESQQPFYSAPGATTDELHWFQLGAKPKAPISSAPVQSDPWTVVESRSGSGTRDGRLSRSSNTDIELRNKFSLLEDEEFSSLRRGSLGPTKQQQRSSQPDLPPPVRSQTRASAVKTPYRSLNLPRGRGAVDHRLCWVYCMRVSFPHHHLHLPLQLHPEAPWLPPSTRRAKLLTVSWEALLLDTSSLNTLCDRGHGSAPAGGPAARRNQAHISADAPASAPKPGPSVLVLGSSMVRSVRINKAHTSSHPGAVVKDITDSAPTIFNHSFNSCTPYWHK